jgi:two-component sensor histidine kinase
LLAGELVHRIKNIFSVITGLVALHSRGNDTLKEFARTLSETIWALARAQDFALQIDTHTEQSLNDLLQVLMAPYGVPGARAISIGGDDIAVGTRAATPLALIFHELATNSAKYGALSAAEGTVSILLTRTDKEAAIVWRERGGPPAKPPENEGFGSRLMRKSIEHQLGGRVELEWDPVGLTAEIGIPLARLER